MALQRRRRDPHGVREDLQIGVSVGAGSEGIWHVVQHPRWCQRNQADSARGDVICLQLIFNHLWDCLHFRTPKVPSLTHHTSSAFTSLRLKCFCSFFCFVFFNLYSESNRCWLSIIGEWCHQWIVDVLLHWKHRRVGPACKDLNSHKISQNVCTSLFLRNYLFKLWEIYVQTSISVFCCNVSVDYLNLI